MPDDTAPPHCKAQLDAAASDDGNAVMRPYPVWREALRDEADAALAQQAFDHLALQAYRTSTCPASRTSGMASKPTGTSHLLCAEDACMPPGYPWRSRLSGRLGLIRLVSCPGSRELCFTEPQLLAQKIEEAGRD